MIVSIFFDVSSHTLNSTFHLATYNKENIQISILFDVRDHILNSAQLMAAYNKANIQTSLSFKKNCMFSGNNFLRVWSLSILVKQKI